MRLPAAVVAIAVLAAPAAAQETVYFRERPPAWLGFSYELRWVQAGNQCSPQVVVEGVVQGSPAERAGLRTGDAIVALDDEPVPPGRIPAVSSRLAPGDSVRLRVLRDGANREVTAVADRRPDRPLRVFVERESGLRASNAPIMELVGDTLVARNLTTWNPGDVRSYWVQTRDGQTEYRSLDRRSRTPLDTRVLRLLACADSAQHQVSVWAPASDATEGTLRRLQERADSLRVIITERARQRADSATTLRYLPREGDEEAGRRLPSTGARTGTVRLIAPEGSYTFRVEEHVAVGLRGVAGAELTALEPELADYFRNVDQGLLVLRIAPDSPADRAGLRPGDVVIAADGRRLDSVAELRRILARPHPGAIDLQVVRRGRARVLKLPTG